MREAKYGKLIKINLNDTEKIKPFINEVRKFMSDIDIMTERAVVDAKSILGVYTLDLSREAHVGILSDDVNEIRKFESAMEEFR